MLQLVEGTLLSLLLDRFVRITVGSTLRLSSLKWKIVSFYF